MQKIILLHPNNGNLGDKYIWSSCFESIRRTFNGKIDYFPLSFVNNNFIDINSYDLAILCGGPILGNKNNQFHRFFSKKKIIIPILPYGVGTQLSFNETNPFDEKSKELLRNIHNKLDSSVRDNDTKKQLNEIGITNTEVTGCPSLFLIPNEKPVIQHREINNIIVTIKPRHENGEYNLKLLQTIKKIFPDKKLVLSLHDTRKVTNYYHYIYYAIQLGYQILDTTTLKNMLITYQSVEQNYDMHIGFRLHAHIAFLTANKPSFLIHCDNRGKSFSETFNIKTDIHREKINQLSETIHKELDNKCKTFNSFTEEYIKKLDLTKKFLKKHFGTPYQKPIDTHLISEHLS